MDGYCSCYDTNMKSWQVITGGIFLGSVLFASGFVLGSYLDLDRASLLNVSPFVQEKSVAIEKPYLKFSIPNLHEKTYAPSSLRILETMDEGENFTSYLYSSTNESGKTMTGQLNLPAEISNATPVILMLRGYVPPEGYATGIGTRNAANVFAKNGFITIAPDFLGYGESDPEVDDPWQARFEKPSEAISVLRSIEYATFTTPTELPYIITKQDNKRPVGIWAHSNGGQIALTLLEITSDPIPATLWAPVTAPFPYSVLFYADEQEDEGRSARLWVNSLEKEYDLRLFSLSQHLNYLAGPIQLHHGWYDEAAPKSWSDEFVQKLLLENMRRESSTDSAELAPIKYEYFEYPNANHNLVPDWNTAVTRDLDFFKRELL